MEHKHTKILFAVALLVCVFAVGYWVWGQQFATDELPVQEQVQGQITEVVDVSEKTRPPLNGPEDWKEYWNDEWGIGFKYPNNWVVKAYHDTVTEKLIIIRIDGDDYVVKIGRSGGGLPEKEWTHPPYVVDGEQARAWQTEDGDGYLVIVSTKRYGFRITTPNTNKDIPNTILATVKYY